MVLSIRRTVPVPWVELHCHGGSEVVRLCLELLQARGVQLCTWQQLEHLTCEDPLRAAATIALAEARTVRTATILLDQYHGALRRAFDAVITALDQGDLSAAQTQLNLLISRIPIGRHLIPPWRIVIAGPPNVGKSSLLNALAGYQRSIVSSIPGTTRDVVSINIAVDGWPVELRDTAGLRADAERLEAEGIDRAFRAAIEADLVLWLHDGSAAPVAPPWQASHVWHIINKADLPPGWDWNSVAGLPMSAQSGAGVEDLFARLAGWIAPASLTPGCAVPFTPELCANVEAAAQLLADAKFEEVRRVLKHNSVA
ncbi:MAG: 50S ribosome-binding GTPase [Gemmataceae bacterium]|nr:50S ribosome-binding GTPase [Gemmataceae bacterium]